MGEDFTVYRGDSGTPYLIGPRCAHRDTQLSVGSIEGECIRCFYHGWNYDGSGQCVDQPAEGESFADKIRIPGYPIQEYIGLIFAYVGEGDPPPLPRYPRFESPDISLDVAALRRICNYFNNIDNSLDNAHVRFVHQRHRKSVDDHVVRGDPMITVEESEWGIRRYVKYPDGKDLTFFFGMPNINFINGQVVDSEIKRADVIVFKVPVDDDSHIHFEVRAIPLTGDRGRAWIEERRQLRAKAEKRSAGISPGNTRRKTSRKRRGSEARRFCHAPRRDRANRPGSDRPAQQRTSRPQRARRLSSAQNLGTRAAHPSGGQADQAMDLPAGNGPTYPQHSR